MIISDNDTTIIAIPSEKKYHRRDLLQLDKLFATQSPTNEQFKDGTILLSTDREEPLPFYLRSEMTGRLTDLCMQAREWNTAIIIPDIVQRHLFLSETLYPEKIVTLYGRTSTAITRRTGVENARGELGFLETEKMLLLELLLRQNHWHLDKVVLTLRKHKVFCLRLSGPELSRARTHIIVKFDSAAAVQREAANLKRIEKLLMKTGDPDRFRAWKQKAYELDTPCGHEHDLLALVSSTVQTVGSVKSWNRQTLTDRWKSIVSNRRKSVVSKPSIDTIIDNVFSTLGELYSLGLSKQKNVAAQQRSVGELYRFFYKPHIMPVDYVLESRLDYIQDVDDNGRVPETPSPAIGREFSGNDFTIKEIKLRENEGYPPLISLIAQRKQELIELQLGPLGDFDQRRDIYKKKLTAKKPRAIKGVVKATFENECRETLQKMRFQLGSNRTESVVVIQAPPGDFIEFSGGHKYPDPFNYIQRLGSDKFSGKTFKSIRTYIHGDLHGRNIITTPSGEARFIDFAKLVTDGPLEFDFAELEIDIRIRNLFSLCEEPGEDVPTLIKHLFAFENGLLDVFVQPQKYAEVSIPARFTPGFRAIKKIRETAIGLYEKLTKGKLSRAEVLLPYMTAIYFESLSTFTFKIEPLAKTWVLIAATVASEKIFSGHGATLHASV